MTLDSARLAARATPESDRPAHLHSRFRFEPRPTQFLDADGPQPDEVVLVDHLIYFDDATGASDSVQHAIVHVTRAVAHHIADAVHDETRQASFGRFYHHDAALGTRARCGQV